MATQPRETTGWVGWVYYAGFMMILLGAFHAIAGLAALLNDKVYVLGPQNLWILDITQWGWIHLIMGLLVAFAGGAVFSGKVWGRTFGVILAGISAIANMAFIPVYPFWSILLLVVDMLVIYALIAHGSELAE